MRSFDDEAVEFLPIRLMISMVIIGVITLLFILGSSRVSREVADNQIEQQLLDLETKLNLLVTTGSPRDLDHPIINGSLRSYRLYIPEHVHYVCFGGDPTIETEDSDMIQHHRMMSSIVYLCEPKSKRIRWLDQKIRLVKGSRINDEWTLPPNPEMFVCTESGTYDLCFELVERNNDIYVMIYR